MKSFFSLNISKGCTLYTRRRTVSRTSLFLMLYFFSTLHPYNVFGAELGISYEVIIQGVDEPKMLELLQSVSDALALAKTNPPATLGLLRRRIDRDVGQFLKVLKSEGHYGGRVTGDINTKTDPVHVTFQVDPGPAYPLKSVDIQTTQEGAATKEKPPDLAELGLTLGQAARGRTILNAEEKLLRHFKKRGFAFTRLTDRRVEVNHREKSVAVTYQLELGQPARFGNTEIKGLQSIDEAFLRSKIPWKKGDQFNIKLLEDAQTQMIATGLFSTVKVSQGETLQEERFLPVNIAVTERKHRSISAGVSYRTDEGAGANISWEHRNLLGRGERLKLDTAVSGISLSIEGTFFKPQFLRNDQTLRLNLRFADENTDAFDSRNISSAVLVDRKLTKEITVGAGLAHKFSIVEQIGETERFSLLSLPLHFDWDSSDKLLDPTRGGRLILQLAPYQDIEETDLNFLKSRITATHYIRLLASPSVVLAGRASLGTINGAALLRLPADERFYAGGGGSIRGYAYQSVGPLDEDDDPIGGRSVLELSAELRFKLTDRLGMVTFLDGGSAFATTVPGSSKDLHWAAGLGFRYFTPIGPLRLDVGFPLDRRKDIDDAFQIYVSIGQAF
jgi:translocation and assembly module TamA